MTTAPEEPTRIFAHRGFSSRQPEMTLAAYQEAIEWSLAEGVPLGLECDVQLSADSQLVCLHDPKLGRTTDARGLVGDWSLGELRRLDFGSWRVPDPSPAQRSLVSLAELLALVHGSRARGAQITLAIETKHDAGRTLILEELVCQLLAGYGWDSVGAPVRLITFSPAGAGLLVRLVPEVETTLLVEKALGPYAEGALPEGIRVAGIDIDLLRDHPDFVARARTHGNEVHSWTVNEVSDLELCRDLGVSGITTDFPDRALSVLCPPSPSELPRQRQRRRSKFLAA